MNTLELTGFVVAMLTFGIQILKGKFSNDPKKLQLFSLAAGLVAGIVVVLLKDDGAYQSIIAIIGSVFGPTILHAGIQGNVVGDTLKAVGDALPLPNAGMPPEKPNLTGDSFDIIAARRDIRAAHPDWTAQQVVDEANRRAPKPTG